MLKFTRKTSKALTGFWKYYEKLPPDIKLLAKRKFILFLQNPGLVYFKRISATDSPPFYSVRINDSYRAVGYLEKNTIYWVWVGPHDEYMRFLKQITKH